MQVHPVLKAIMDMAGEKFIIIRDDTEIEEIDGMRNKDQYSERRYIAVYPHVDLREGDWLRAVTSGDEFYIENKEIEICDSETFQGRAYYFTKEEWEKSPQKISGDTSEKTEHDLSSDHIRASNSRRDDHMNYLQALVRVKAPGQVQEFQPLLDEMYDLLGRSNLEAGTLNKYESLLNSHRWLKKAVAEALIAWFI